MLSLKYAKSVLPLNCKVLKITIINVYSLYMFWQMDVLIVIFNY